MLLPAPPACRPACLPTRNSYSPSRPVRSRPTPVRRVSINSATAVVCGLPKQKTRYLKVRKPVFNSEKRPKRCGENSERSACLPASKYYAILLSFTHEWCRQTCATLTDQREINFSAPLNRSSPATRNRTNPRVVRTSKQQHQLSLPRTNRWDEKPFLFFPRLSRRQDRLQRKTISRKQNACLVLPCRAKRLNTPRHAHRPNHSDRATTQQNKRRKQREAGPVQNVSPRALSDGGGGGAPDEPKSPQKPKTEAEDANEAPPLR